MKTKDNKKKNTFGEFNPNKVIHAPKTFETVDKFGRHHWKTEN